MAFGPQQFDTRFEILKAQDSAHPGVKDVEAKLLTALKNQLLALSPRLPDGRESTARICREAEEVAAEEASSPEVSLVVVAVVAAAVGTPLQAESSVSAPQSERRRR